MDRYDIKQALERAVDYLAEASAAQAWSTPLDSDPEDTIIVAEFGDWVAVNGDLVFQKGKPGHPGAWGDIPKGTLKDYVTARGGGRIPGTEEEVGVDHIVDAAAIALGVPRGKSLSRAKIEAVAREMFGGKDVTYTSVSGESTNYVKRGKEDNPKMKKIDPSDIDEFTRAYIEAALWSSTDDNGDPLDKNYSPADIAPPTLKRMIADCKKFQKENADDLATWPGGQYSAEEMGGHDFWLSRNGHGSGFFDGAWPDDVGDRLQDAARKFHEFNLYVGDDGLIHGTPL